MPPETTTGSLCPRILLLWEKSVTVCLLCLASTKHVSRGKIEIAHYQQPRVSTGRRAVWQNVLSLPRWLSRCYEVKSFDSEYQYKERVMVFTKAKADESHSDRVVTSAQEEIRHLARNGNVSQPQEASSISSGLSIVGKITGYGALTIFGHVDGEVHASTVAIAEGAQIVGDIVAEELTINGHVKGTINANRVRLGNNCVVEGDIHHRTLAIEENARFEGMSRRNESAIDTKSLIQTNRAKTQATPTEPDGKGNGTS
jgi:cytoskeletal protein CcmA (bactofilin family)